MKILSRLIHITAISTVLSIVLFFTSLTELSVVIGNVSIIYSFLTFVGSSNGWIALLSLVYLLTFSAFYVVSYILSFWKKYMLSVISVGINCIAAIIFVAYKLLIENYQSILYALLGLVISIVWFILHLRYLKDNR